MKVSIIASIVLGSAVPSAIAEPSVEELDQRVEQLEKTVEILSKRFALLVEKAGVMGAVPARPDDAAPANLEVIINVRADGGIHLDGKKLTLDELKGELKKLSERNKDQPVRILGIGVVEYQPIMEVINACGSAGLSKILLGTQKKENDPDDADSK